MISMRQVFKKIKKIFFDIFLILAPPELLSLYADIDISH